MRLALIGFLKILRIQGNSKQVCGNFLGRVAYCESEYKERGNVRRKHIFLNN